MKRFTLPLMLLPASYFLFSVHVLLLPMATAFTAQGNLKTIRPSAMTFFPTLLRSSSSSLSNSEQDEQKGRSKKSNKKSTLDKPKEQENTMASSSSMFAMGEELKRLRADVSTLRENLQWAEAMDDHGRVDDLQSAISTLETRDPDVTYARAMQDIQRLQKSSPSSQGSSSSIVSVPGNGGSNGGSKKEETIEELKELAAAARAVLPKFQLEGLWVGNFGDNGPQLINVTYASDTLVATKCTGDVNVPRGQVSFTVDLASHNSSAALEPLKLSLEQIYQDRKKSGSDKTSSSEDNAPAGKKSKKAPSATTVPRFAGRGQIAKPNFSDHKFVEGQMVLFAKHFSFIWIPSRHHILFRRPTPEQIIDLLRDVVSQEDEMENMRNHVTRCWDMDMTDSLARQHADLGNDPMRRIALSSDLVALEKEKARHDDLTDHRQQSSRKKKRNNDKNTSISNARQRLEEDEKDENSSAFNFWHVHKWRQYIDEVLNDDHSSMKRKNLGKEHP